MSDRIDIKPGAPEVADAARDLVVSSARHAIATRGVFHWALSGGSTPRAAYARIAELPPGAIDWARVHVWFGDERCVPSDHAESNFRMASEAMLSRVPIPPDNVRRIECERGPVAAANSYDALLAEVFGRDVPSFDLAFLGLGADGHTASLFGDSDFPTDAERLAIGVTAPPAYSVRERVSVTHHVLARARVVAFLVAGAEKRDMLSRVLAPSTDEDRRLPAAMIAASCHSRWIVDRNACAG